MFPSANQVSVTPDNVNRFNYFQQDEFNRQIYSPAGTGIAITKTARPFQESKASAEKSERKRAAGFPSRQTTLAKGVSMKRNGFRVLTSLLAVVMLGIPVIYAGSIGSVEATIPFDFIVGKMTLPAGQYTVSPLDHKRGLVVRSEDGKSTAMVLTMGVQTKSAKNQARLVFNRYGNTYFLSQVWRGYDSEGFALHKSNQEREIALNQNSSSVTLTAQAR
jgi:hypothetical protein